MDNKHKILIGIDGNEANINYRVGVNTFAFEIIRGMYKILPGNPDLIVNVYLKDEPLSDMPKENDQFKYKILKGGRVWIITKLMPHLFFSKDKPDVFYTPSHYVPPISFVPRVCSIMDLGFIEFSAQFRKYDYWQLKWWTAWSVKVSKYITTISLATAKDIVRLYPASKDKVVVTYPGYDESLLYLKMNDGRDSELATIKNKYSIVKDYVLYLGTLKPSKNIEGLIDAWGKIVNKYPNLQLVIGGKKGWLYDAIFKKVTENGLEDKIVFTDFVLEKDKALLIKGAKIFILPSFWEGFGLDILSAFALGVPVITTNVGSLPEVVGDAGMLINPKDTNLIANAIAKILSMSKNEHDKLISKGQNQLKKFSWEKTAKVTLEILRKAAK